MGNTAGSAFILMMVVMASTGCQEPDSGDSGDSGGEVAATSSSSGLDQASSGEQAGPPHSLVRYDAWELTPVEDDPFADERPDWIQCELGFDVETGTFEVSTELCLYGAFMQKTLARIRKGDTLELVLMHDALYAEEPATAHVAIAFGEEIAWEIELPIPSEAAQLRPTWTATEDVPVNSPVHFHVHNHGTNNYRFIDLTVDPG